MGTNTTTVSQNIHKHTHRQITPSPRDSVAWEFPRQSMSAGVRPKFLLLFPSFFFLKKPQRKTGSAYSRPWRKSPFAASSSALFTAISRHRTRGTRPEAETHVTLFASARSLNFPLFTAFFLLLSSAETRPSRRPKQRNDWHRMSRIFRRRRRFMRAHEWMSERCCAPALPLSFVSWCIRLTVLGLESYL